MIGDTVRAPEPARPYLQEVGADPGKLRIALLDRNPLGTGEIHPDCVAATRAAGRLLESLGPRGRRGLSRIDRRRSPRRPLHELVGRQPGVLGLARLRAKIGRPITADDVEGLTWSLTELGNHVSAADYIEAEHAIIEMTRDVESWFARAATTSC